MQEKGSIKYSKSQVLSLLRTLKPVRPNISECEIVRDAPNTELEILKFGWQLDEDEMPSPKTGERPKDGHPHFDAPVYVPRNMTNPAATYNGGEYARGYKSRSANKEHTNEEIRFDVDVERIEKGLDARTTLMIKNIPNKYSQRMLLTTVEEEHKSTFDFAYLPIDFRVRARSLSLSLSLSLSPRIPKHAINI